jgi:hypothetical protein
MKLTRLVVTIALLLFVGATVGTLIAQEVARPERPRVADGSEASSGVVQAAAAEHPETATIDEPQPAGVEAPNQAEPPEETVCVVDAIYFHNTNRCWTCQKIERDAKAVVEAEFADELAAAALRWSAINMEEERQYVDRYELTQPTLVLIRNIGDESEEWTALDQTWALVRDETRYATYLVEGFRAFLEGCP